MFSGGSGYDGCGWASHSLSRHRDHPSGHIDTGTFKKRQLLQTTRLHATIKWALPDRPETQIRNDSKHPQHMVATQVPPDELIPHHRHFAATDEPIT